VLESFAADIPEPLLWADELLTGYGRWATRRSGGRHCASAEGMYRAPRRGEYAPATAQPTLSAAQAVGVNRALQRVPDANRTVLKVLYVPDRLPVAAQLRILRIPPSLCRIRHLDGLRMFSNVYGG